MPTPFFISFLLFHSSIPLFIIIKNFLIFNFQMNMPQSSQSQQTDSSDAPTRTSFRTTQKHKNKHDFSMIRNKKVN